MGKYLLYAMRGEKMCFVHVLLNALSLHEPGCTVKIVFEGQSVGLPILLDKENNPLYRKALYAGLIAGVCLACAKTLGAYDGIAALGLPFISDMSGHAAILPYIQDGYKVLVF